MKKVLIPLAFLSANIIHSQVTVTNDGPTNLIQNVLIGSGVLVSNISYQGDTTTQFGSFTAAPGTPIDFSDGIILSTFGMNSPTCLQQGGGGYFGAGTPGDADLSATAGGGTTTDAAWIQFDFIPTGDTMKFDYIFGSQEYNVFVNTGFNDVFAFYLTGPNPLGGNYTVQNVAIIPGSPSVPVTINNVNNGNSGGCGAGPCEYCAFFVDNNPGCVPPPSPQSPFTGGYTTNLQVVVPVVPCSTYTIKLGVADLLDQALNSFVMLKANSFVSNQVIISSETELQGVDTVLAADSIFYEGCTYTTLSFVREGNLTAADTVTFGVSGTATMGVDYGSFSTTIIFPPGEDTVQIQIIPYEDLTNEPIEYVTITIVDTICNQPQFTIFTLFISDSDSLTIFAGNDTMACPGIPFTFDATANGGANLFNIQWQAPNNNVFDDDSTFAVMIPGFYSVAVYEYCLDTTVYDSVYLAILQPPATGLNNVLACSGEPINIGSPAIPGYNMTWSPGTNLNNVNLSDPTFTGTNGSQTPLVFNYNIQLDSAGYQCFSDSITVTLYMVPIVDIGDSIQQCEGAGIINLNAGNPGLSYLWNTGATSQGILTGFAGTYGVTVTVPGTSCAASDSVIVIIYPAFNLQLPDQQVCALDIINIGLTGSPGINYAWSPPTNISSTVVSDPIFGSPTPGSFTYYLSLDSAGYTCTYDTITVTVNPNPVVNMADSTVLCENGTVNLNSGVAGATYLWNTGATTQSITVNAPGIYGVLVTNPTTCFDTDSIVVTFDSLPHFTINDVTVCEGDSAVLFVNPNEGNSFLWSSGQTTPSMYTFTPGFYVLTVGNSCGTSTDTAQVFFKPDLKNLPMPNVLTLNDDGTNDLYSIPILAELESFRMDFFDRWGVLLYSTTDVNAPWAGTSGANGGKVPPGTYFVVIEFFNCTGEEINKTQFITVFH